MHTIKVKAYFPTGDYAMVALEFDSLDTMPTADEITQGIESKGFTMQFDGVEAGDSIQTVTHVSRREKIESDGTKTPILAFYHENAALKFKLDHKYMNTAEDIAQFEAVSGIKLSDIPLYDGEGWLPRDHAKAARYVIQMAKPVKVSTYKDEYEFNGKKDTKDYIRNFIGAPKASTPDNVTDITAQQSPKQGYTEATNVAVTKMGKNNKPYIVIEQCSFFTREPFRALGFDESVIEQLAQVGVTNLPAPVQIVYTTNENGYRDPLRIKHVGTGQVIDVQEVIKAVS